MTSSSTLPDAGTLMKQVRAFWRDNVGAAGADDTGADAPVVKAFRSAWDATKNKQVEAGDAVSRAVWETPEYKHAHQGVVESVFLSIAHRKPSEHETKQFEGVHDAEDIAHKVLEIKEGSDSEESSSSQDAASPTSRDTGGPDQSTPIVDENWLAQFRNAYGRDAFVHEYVLVRPMKQDLGELAARHKQSFRDLRSVHAKFLDDDLDEHTFVKVYVPRVYHSRDVADEVRRGALVRPKYRSAMQSRLSSLHVVACGSELTEQESAYLFEKDVLEKQLPLDTDELNSIVAAFVRRGEEIEDEIRAITDIYLHREAEQDEVEAWRFKFRTLEGAESQLRREMVSRHEFHAVLTDTIRTRLPDVRSRELFERVTRALKLPDLAALKSRYDMDSVLERAGIFELV